MSKPSSQRMLYVEVIAVELKAFYEAFIMVLQISLILLAAFMTAGPIQ